MCITRVYTMNLNKLAFLRFFSNVRAMSVILSFLVGAIILLFVMCFLKKMYFKIYVKSVFLLGLYGYLSGLIGVFFIFSIGFTANMVINLSGAFQINNECFFMQIIYNIMDAIFHSLYDSILGTIFLLIGVLVEAVLTFFLDYKCVFKRCFEDLLTEKQIIIVSIVTAVLSPACLILIPLISPY